MTDTSVAPYFDDFDEDKGFHRLLFRPGRAVQARELTQLQTILQNQITRFGQNIFVDGTVVIPGGVSVDDKYEYITVQETDVSDLVAGATIVGNTSSLIATVLQIVEVEGGDPATIYVRYTGGGSGEGGRFQDGETLTYTNLDLSGGTFTASASDAAGVGTRVVLDKGVYFIKGFFAAAPSQALIVEKYGVPVGIQEVGLIAEEEIITSADDSSLLDNANGSSNFNAPGADRLKISLTMTKKDDITDTAGNVADDYFTIVKLDGTEIIEALTRSRYALLGDELARRTYDESGNYTVDPFIGSITEDPDDETKLILTVDPGKAYVRGYEVTKTVSTNISIDKALDTSLVANTKVPTPIGSYVRTAAPTGLPALDTFAQVNLLDASDATIGTARVRGAYRESGSIYRFYLFMVSMNPTKTFNQVRKLSSSPFTVTLVGPDNVALSTNTAVLQEASASALLFPLANPRGQSIEDITVRIQRMVDFTASGGGTATLDTGSATITWEATSEWIIVRTDTGAVVSPTIAAAGSQTIGLTGLAAGVAHRAYALADRTATGTNARTKTLTSVVDETVTPDGDDIVTLANHDIFAVLSVVDDTTSEDITSRYTLDNGQRDTFYGLGRLILKTGQTAPAGDVLVTYDYFEHGSGAYFNVDSYNSLVSSPSYDYGDIPVHTLSNGTDIRLSDCFDFRPRINDAGTGFSGTGALVNELPQPNQTIQADIDYYVPRIDVVHLAPNGEFGVTQGVPSFDPQIPAYPNTVMPIYVLSLNAGTLDETDLRARFIENRRYTMRDIGAIEKRVAKVEEWTTLSLLESDTASLTVLDNDGNTRFKSGFFVDNFSDHSFSANWLPEYRASIDPRSGELRASFHEGNAPISYVDGDSSGVVLVDDFVMLSYTSSSLIEQRLASSTVNVNPYSVITGIGSVRLSPASDEWRDVVTVTNPTTVQTIPNVNPDLGANWNNWLWGWAGSATINPQVLPIISGVSPDSEIVGGISFRNRLANLV